MAHRSKKKHLKHVHEHEPATPPAKHPGTKAKAAIEGIAKPRTKRAAADRRVVTAEPQPKQMKGIVRAIARRTKKIVAKPRNMLERAKARVKSLLGKD